MQFVNMSSMRRGLSGCSPIQRGGDARLRVRGGGYFIAMELVEGVAAALSQHLWSASWGWGGARAYVWEWGG